MKAKQNHSKIYQVLLLALIPVIFSGFMACGGTAELDYEAEAKKLQTEVKGWDKWKQHKDFSGIQKSEDGTHGGFVAIYMNDTAAGAQGKLNGSFPNGSIFVKRGYDDKDGKKPKAWVTIMKKIDGSDPDNGNWFTMSLTDDGKLSKYTKSDKGGCMGCHAKYKGEHDYIGMMKEGKFTF